ncbi:MAG: hypothetical protein KGL46_03450 [Hyphomicrobiales bacterium]|nr:hypothetical protein [Hyphomicrobiales bacterium]
MFNVAIAADWKRKFNAAIDSGATIDLAVIERSEPGVRFQGRALERYAACAAFDDCRQAHVDLQRAALRIGELINRQQYEAAAAALGPRALFAVAARRARQALERLEAEAAA